MTTCTARTIPVDKHAIRELAKELEQDILDAVSHRADPLGKRVIVQRPYEVRAVDGSTSDVHVRLEAVPSRDFKFIVGGGLGKSLRGLPVAVIFVNGSLDAQALANGAKTHLVQLQIYPTLLHELTHAADKFTKGFGVDQSEQDLRDDLTVYYNHPGEVRAYMQEVVDEASERFKHYEKLKKNFGSRGFSTLLNLSKTWQEVSPHWTARNQQKVIKAVYRALEDWQMAQRVAGRVVARECKPY